MAPRAALGGAAMAAGVVALAASFAVPYRALDDDAHPPVEALLGDLDGAGRLIRIEEPDGSTTWTSITTRRLPDLLLTDVDDTAVDAVLRRIDGDLDAFSLTGDLPGVALYRDELVDRRASGAVHRASLSLLDEDGYALIGFVGEDGGTQVFDPPLPLLPADPEQGSTWSGEGDFAGTTYRYEAEVVEAGTEGTEVAGDQRCLVVASELVLAPADGEPSRQTSEERWCEGLGSERYTTETDSGVSEALLVAADGHTPAELPEAEPLGADDELPVLGEDPWVRTSVISPLGGVVTPYPSMLPTVVPGEDPLLLVGNEATPTIQAVRTVAGEGAARAWTVATGEVVYGAPLVDVDGGRIFAGSAEGEVRAFAADGLFLWSTDVGDNVATRPALAGEVLVVGSEDGDVVGLDAGDGRERWRTSTGGPVVSWPAVLEDLVVVGSDDGVVRAIDADTGEVRWSHEAGGGVEAPITALADGVLVADRSGMVARLDGDGAVRWSATPGGTLRTAVTVVDGDQGVLVGGGDVISLDLETGEERWRLRGDYVGPVAPVAGRASLVALAEDGRLVALDPAGEVAERWRATTSPTGGASYDVGPVAGAGAIWLVDEGGQVQRLGAARAGQVAELPMRWAATVTVPPFEQRLLQASPLVDGDDTYLLDGGGAIYRVDVATGAIERTGAIGSGDLNVVIGGVAEDGVAYLSSAGRLIRFSLPGGEVEWEHPVAGTTMRPPVLAGDAVLLVTEDEATHRLAVLDRDDGSLRWERDAGTSPVPGALSSPLLVVGDLVVAGEPLSAWRLSDGEPVWTSTASNVLGAAVELPSGDVAVAVTDGDDAGSSTGTELVVLDAETGEERSRTFLEGVLIDGLSDLAVAGDLVVGQDAGRTAVVGIDPAESTGAAWELELPGRRLGRGALLGDGLLWVALIDGRVVAIDPAEGTEVGRSPELGVDLSDASLVQVPVLQGDVVVVAGGVAVLGVSAVAP